MEYVFQIRDLKQALGYGLDLRNMHSIIKFN